jgi:hypothetical protein
MSDEKTVIKPDTSKYTKGRSPSGAKTLNCGDDVAAVLEGMTVEEVTDVFDKLTGSALDKDYSHLNPGQQRMIIGNRIRAYVAKNENADLNKASASARKSRDARVKEAEKAKAEKEKTKKAA